MSRRLSTNLVNIIYEDPDIVVVSKPAGIATEGGRGSASDMESLLKNAMAARGKKPEIFVIHRLDQPVEGLLVFGKNEQAAAELSRQVRNRSVRKYYLAVGVGSTGDRLCAEGTLTDWVERVPGANLSRICGKGQGKRAELFYRVRGERTVGGERLAVFDIRLHTGRHHQIRLQLAHMGWPILGDRKYGHVQADGKETGGQGLALCAYRLVFAHPMTGERMDFSIRPQHPLFAEFDRDNL